MHSAVRARSLIGQAASPVPSVAPRFAPQDLTCHPIGSRYNEEFDSRPELFTMPKGKTHKGLQKRVKVTAGGKVKFRHSCGSHLNSHMSGNKIRQLRGKKLIQAGDVKRAAALLQIPVKAGR